MSVLHLSKDTMIGDESRMKLIIDLSIDGKVDSHAAVKFYYKENEKDKVECTAGLFHIEGIRKLKKVKPAADGSIDPSQFNNTIVSSFMDLLNNSDLVRAIKHYVKEYGNPAINPDNVEKMVAFKILFCLYMLSSVDKSCTTVFPCDIGGGSLAASAIQMELMDGKKFGKLMKETSAFDYATDAAIIGGTIATNSAALSTAAGAASSAVGGALSTAGTAVGGALSTAVTGTAVVSEAVAIETVATVGGTEIVSLSTAALAETGAGALAAHGAGAGAAAAIGAAALPLTIIAFASISAIMVTSNLIKTRSLIQATDILGGYSTYIQQGNIRKYIELNNLEANEVWRALDMVAQQSGATNIFEVEESLGKYIL